MAIQSFWDPCVPASFNQLICDSVCFSMHLLIRVDADMNNGSGYKAISYRM
jgi:hypothetical protein